MKKAGAIFLVIALCLTTVISYGDILKPKKSTAPSNVLKAESIEDIKAAQQEQRIRKATSAGDAIPKQV